MDILTFSVTAHSTSSLEISLGIQTPYDMTYDLTDALQTIEDETDETSIETKARNVERLAIAKAQVLWMNGRGQKSVRFSSPSLTLQFHLASDGSYYMSRYVNNLFLSTSTLTLLSAIHKALYNAQNDLSVLMAWLKKKKAIELIEMPEHVRDRRIFTAYVEALSRERFDLSSRLKDADLAA